MDAELDKRLRVIEGKISENNALLTRMRRVQRNTNLFKIVYWLVFLVLGIISLYLLQPYVMSLMEGYGTVKDSLSGMKEMSNFLKSK